MNRVRLDDWTCPSGNNVIGYYRAVSDDSAIIEMRWDAPPPLSAGDLAYYRSTIQPALFARIREYTERVGSTLVVTLL